MTKLGAVQIYAYARAAGFPDGDIAATMTAIALAESGGRTDAIGDVALENATWGPSVGLWQIRSLKAQYGSNMPRDASRLTDPAFNAHAALSIWGGAKKAGHNPYGPWSTYTNGAYRAFMDQANAAKGTTKGGGGIDVGDVVKIVVPGAGLIPGVGGAVAGAAGGALKGIDAVGHFFAALAEKRTWIRVLQVMGGIGCVAGGLALLGFDTLKPLAGAAVDVVPGGSAVKAAANAAAATTPTS